MYLVVFILFSEKKTLTNLTKSNKTQSITAHRQMLSVKETKRIPKLYRTTFQEKKFHDMIKFKQDNSLEHCHYIANSYYDEDAIKKENSANFNFILKAYIYSTLFKWIT